MNCCGRTMKLGTRLRDWAACVAEVLTKAEAKRARRRRPCHRRDVCRLQIANRGLRIHWKAWENQKPRGETWTQKNSSVGFIGFVGSIGCFGLLVPSFAFPVPNSAFRVTQYPVCNQRSFNPKSKIRNLKSQSGCSHGRAWIHGLSGLVLCNILEISINDFSHIKL